MLTEGFLYDKNQCLIKYPFQKDIYLYDRKKPHTNDIFPIYIYGSVKKGQFISTYYIYGVAFPTSSKEIAFGIAMEDKNYQEIDKINVKFL